MKLRCADTHFYVSGHKTRSGHAVYVDGQGQELRVVCGRRRPGPGEIHLHDLADGTILEVAGQVGTVSLRLVADKTQGRAGRQDFWRLWDIVTSDTSNLATKYMTTLIWNQLYELDDHGGGGEWAQSVTSWWFTSTFGSLELLHARTPGGPHATALDALLGTNAHLYLDPSRWRLVAGQEGTGPPVERHVRRLIGDLERRDPIRERGHYQAAAAELVAIMSRMSVQGEDMVAAYSPDRLAGVLATYADTGDQALVTTALNALGTGATASVSMALARRLARSGTKRLRDHGVALAAAVYDRPDNPAGTSEQTRDRTRDEADWATLTILSEPGLAALHAVAVERLDADLLSAARAVACAPARALLPQGPARPLYSVGSMAATFVGRPVPNFASRAPELAGIATILGADAATRIAQARRAPRSQLSAFADNDTRYQIGVPPWSNRAPGRAYIEHCLSRGITDLGTIDRLSRAGVMISQIDAYPDRGASSLTTALECGRVRANPQDVADYHALGLDSWKKFAPFARHGVNAAGVAAFRYLDVADHDACALGDAGVLPSEYAYFAAAGKKPAQAMAAVAQGVRGPQSLAYSAIGEVDDVDDQALLTRAFVHDDLNAWAAAGYTGATLVGAVAGGMLISDAKALSPATTAKVREALAQGLDSTKVVDYARYVGDLSVPDWAELAAVWMDGEDAAAYVAAGLHRGRDIVVFAKAGRSPQDAQATVTSRPRPLRRILSAARRARIGR